jgi:hypothetical protein
MLWFSGGDTTYRNNGGTPCDPATSLRRAIDIGVSYGMKYIETYQTDVQRLIIRLVPDVDSRSERVDPLRRWPTLRRCAHATDRPHRSETVAHEVKKYHNSGER